MLFLLSAVHGALQAELDRFFDIVRHVRVGSRVVSKAAWTLARRKLHFTAFIELNREVLRQVYAERPVHRWHGFRVLALDGSTLWLPDSPEVRAWWGAPRPRDRAPLGRVSVLYDVLNRLIVTASLAPLAVAERSMAGEQLDDLQADDLVLMDRGYPAFWLFAALHARGRAFCARVCPTFAPAVRAFVASGARETTVPLCPGPTARRECRRRGLPLTPLDVRLVRVDLPNGTVEVLLTSLRDAQRFPAAIFGPLYQLRWGVEEGYKALKCRVEVENFTGRTALAVLQDFHARVLLQNLVAVLTQQAQPTAAPTSPPRRPNFSYALARWRMVGVHVLTAVDPRPLLDTLLELFRRTCESVRPGRSFPRRYHITLQPFRMNYKRCG